MKYILRFLLCVIFALFITEAAYAQTVRYVSPSPTGSDVANDCTDPGSPCATIAYTISQSEAGDSIQIAAGSYTEFGLTIDTSLTLAGADQTTTFIQAHESAGAGSDRVFDINTFGTVNIYDVTIRHGRNTTADGGGGVRTQNATVSLTDVTVSANRATSAAGGGFRIAGGAVTLTGVTVAGDSATQGGGIFVTSGGSLTIVGGSVGGNVNTGTDQFGGGIYANGSGTMLEMSNGAVVNNNSNNKNGGGIAVNNGASATLDDVTISGNSSNSGGGVWLNQSATVFTLTNSAVSDNTSTGGGGGIFTGGSATATIESVTFDANNAVSGAGIHIGSGILNVSFSSFTNNTGSGQAINHGGGTVTAKRNWWGDASGPTIGSNSGGTGQSLTGSPAYAPWFGAVPGTSPMTFGLNSTGTLGETIGFASSGDDIQMKAGTYTESGLYIDKGLTINGAGAGDDPGLHTILQAHANRGSAIDRVIGVGTISVIAEISGMTIRHGNVTGVGGGLYNDATLTLHDVHLLDNIASVAGGGIYNNSGGMLTMTGCVVASNEAESGGGVYIDSFSDLAITGSTIRDNTASINGGGIYSVGQTTLGGIWEISRFIQGDPVTISGNTAPNNSGGGIYNSSGLLVAGGSIRGNSANYGGGIYSEGTLEIKSATISGNSANEDGGGIFSDFTLTIKNATISGNTATISGGGLYNQSGTPSISNSILWGNSGGQVTNSGSTISYSDIQGSGGSGLLWDGTLGTDDGGNIDQDPLFVGPVAATNAPTVDGDYRIQATSPAIKTGTNAAVDAIHDADANSRIVGGMVDMGAYEYQSALYSVARQVTDNSTPYEFGNAQVNLEFTGIGMDNTLYLFVDYYDSPADDATFSDTPPQNQSVYRWVITKTGNGFTGASVTFTDVSSQPGVTTPSTVTIYSRPTIGLGDFSALATALDVDNLSTTVTSFSEFIFGSDDPDNSLPVQISSFTAGTSRLNAELAWRTESEVENYGFEIERRSVSMEYGEGSREVQRSEVSLPTGAITLTNLGGEGGRSDGGTPINKSPINPAGHNEFPQADRQLTEWAAIGFVRGSGTSTSPKDYSFVDKPDQPGRYAYRIKQIDHSGSFAYTDAVELEVGLAPLVFALAQNYPNPFNPSTTIEFTLPMDGRVVLKIYDLQGREVATLVDEERKAGVYHQVVFDASRLASGLYFSRLQSGNLQAITKMILVK